MRDTLFNRVRSPAERIPQAPEISAQNDKVIRSDRFCLTELAPRGYFASSPQAVVVARRLPAQPVVGGLWTERVYLGTAGGFPVGGELRLVGGMLWH